MTDGTFRRIDEASAEYAEVARLYRIAQQMRPGGLDGWNRELYSRSDGKWGGLQPDGTMRLSDRGVVEQLTGSTDPMRADDQAQALATILHESYHARIPIDAPNEPNAFRARHSKGLDEGLTEYQTVADFDLFAAQTGYRDLELRRHEYPGAYAAAEGLLTYAAANESDRATLADRALDAPLVMRWDVIADEIVRNRLADTVLSDPDHQRAARAHLVVAMTSPQGWMTLDDSPSASGGQEIADQSSKALDGAIADIRQHYQDSPDRPFPAVVPNFELRERAGEQARSMAGAQAAPAAAQAHTALRFLSGSAPAAAAVHSRPNLGDGARGRTGSHGTGPEQTRGRD